MESSHSYLDDTLHDLRRSIHEVPKDGHCIPSAISAYLHIDSNEEQTCQGILRKLRGEFKDHHDYYENFLTGSNSEKELDNYIERKQYAHDIVDLVVVAIATMLQLKIIVYTEAYPGAKIRKDEVIPILDIAHTDDVHLLRRALHYDALVLTQRLARLQSQGDKWLVTEKCRVEFYAVGQDLMKLLGFADDLLTEPAEGVPYEQVEQQLHELKKVCDREQHQQQLLDRLLDLQEQLTPTLDLSARSTLRQTVANLQQKFTDSAEAVRSQKRQLEEYVAHRTDYKLKLANVETFLNDAQDQWQTTSDDIPPDLDSTKKMATSAGEFVQQLTDYKDQLGQLNAVGSALAHYDSQAKRTATEISLANVNDKYTRLHTDAENRQHALEKTVQTWVTYEEHAKMIGHVMREAQEQLPQAALERATSADLGQHLIDTKGVIQTVQQSSTDMAALQQAAQTVLRQLPLSDAKAAIQAELLTLQDSFERLQWESQDQRVAIEMEIAEREKFAAEVGETVRWLQEAQMKLEQPHTMGISLHEAETRLSAIQAMKQDVTMQLDQVQTAIKQLRDKYAYESELPPELAQQLETLTHAEDQVTTLLDETLEGLERAQHTRQEYHDSVGVLKSWISDAEEQVAEPINEHQEVAQKHQRLMQEIEIFRAKLEKLQSYAKELIVSAPEEDAAIIKATVQSLSDCWDQLQKLAVKRSSELSEVGELWDTFDTTAQFLTRHADYTRSVPKTQLVWDSLEQVEKRVQTQRVVVQEVTTNLQELPELEALSKQLEERGVTSVIQRVQNVRELLTLAHTESTEHLALLEATVTEWKECANTLTAVTKFVNEAHDSMEILDDAITLEQKVRASKKLLQDLEHHDASLARVAATIDKLGPWARAGTDHPAAAVNIKELREKAQRRHDHLKVQLQQQQTLEEDAIALKDKIDASQEMLSHPLSAEYAEELQHKIKEHKRLMQEIEIFRAKLEKLQSYAKELIVSAPEEDAAIIKATVQSLSDRWDQLQKLAVKRSSELSEVEEIWDTFETTAQFLTRQADYTRSVPITQLVWDSLEQVEKRVQTQRVVVQEVTTNLQELPELEALSKQLEEHGVTSAIQRVQNVRELLTLAHTESTEHLALLEATVTEWKECANTLTAVTKFVNEAHDSMEILDDAITLEQKVRASKELLQDLEHNEASLARVAATIDKLGPWARAGTDHPAAAVNIEELREKAQRRHDHLKAQLQQQQTLEGDAIALKDKIDASQEMFSHPLSAESAEELQHKIKEHKRLMQEIEIFRAKLEKLQSYAKELIVSAPEEDAAIIKATVQSLSDRWDQLQKLAVKRSSELSEVGELWDTFDTTAQFLTRHADYTRSVPKTQLVWDSLEQVEKRVQTQRVVVQEVTTNLQELPELEALSKQLEERGVTSAIQRVQNVSELLTVAHTESTEHLALLEATVTEWKECANTLTAVTKFVNEAHDSMEILDDAITLEQKVRDSKELLQDLEHNEASLVRVAATIGKLGQRARAGTDHPAAAVNIKELREKAQRRHDHLKAQLKQQQTLEGDAISLKDNIGASQEIFSHPLSAESAEELQHKIKEHKDLALQVHGWQTKLHLLNTQSENIMLRCQDINVEVPPELLRSTKHGKDVADGDRKKLRGLEDLSSLESRASPVSLQSDDTDALLGEYAGVLRSPSDSEAKSETTTLLMAAVEEFAACENMSLADSLETNETGNFSNTASTLELHSASTGLSQQLNMFNINDPTGRVNIKDRPNSYTTSHKAKPYFKDGAMETQAPEARVMQIPGFDLRYSHPNNHRSPSSDSDGVDSDTGYWGDRDIPITPQSLGSGVYTQSRIYPPTIDDLNSAWSRSRVQLEDRLQQQDQHQGRVTDVSRRLEEAAQALAPVDPATMTLTELDLQMQDTQEMFLELDVLEAEMRQMEVENEDTHADPESRAAAAASLRMLRDKHASLQAQAHNREHILKNAVDDRAQYSATVHDFTAQVKQLANWLTTARIAHSGEPMVTYDVPYLRQQLAENQSMQAEISSCLHQLAELGMVAEGLAYIAAPADAQARTLQLSQLTTATTAFKCDALQRQVAIEEALRESERKNEELDDYRQNVASLQSWIQETQKLATAQQQHPGDELELRDEQRKLKEQLTSDLQQHQDVLRSVARQAEGVTHDPDSSTPPSPEVIGANWRRLSRQLSEKKQQALESSPGEFHGRPLESFQHRAIGGGESTTRLSELQNCIGDLNSCWDKLQGQVTDKQTLLENTLHFQQLYQEALINISAWLDDIEQRLFTGMTPGTDLDQHLQENNNLQDQLMQMNHASQQLMAVAGAESHSLISQTVADLHARLKALEDQAQSRQQELQLHQNNSKQHQDEVADVDQKMAELAAQYATLNSLPLDQRAAMWNQLEDKMRQLEEKMRDLKAPGWNQGRSDPILVAPAGLDALSTHWGALQQQASQQKVELDEASSTQTQYESMLEEFSQFLETAQEKLKSDSVVARDLKHLEQQCNAHQDFFAVLESHRSLLDALADSVDPDTRQRFQTSHDRLNRLTQVVQDRANAHGQCLDRLSKQWATFSAQHDDLTAWLNRLERILPRDPGANHLTIDDARKQVWDFHAVEKALMSERGSVLQAMDRGHQLQQLVTCPFLNTQVTDFHEKWMNISNQATEQLKRLQTLTDQWAQFERDAATLETWLLEAHSRVHSIGHVEQLDLGNISAINRKMELFLDFRKEVENQQPLKTKVTTMGRQLAHARGGDPQLEHPVNQIEDQWMALMAELPDNEEQLHNAQMELLPSRQALSELIMWVEGVEKMCRQDSAQSPASLIDLQLNLHKYRGLKVDISNRQLTVDFVNQTAVQSSNIDVSSPRYVNKTEFAEQLGQMNKRYQSVSSDVAERIKSLEMSELRWQDYEKAVGNLTSWFNTQNEKAKSLQKFGHEVSTQQGLADVRALQDQLPGKQSEIDNVRKLGLTLVERQGSIQVDVRNVHVTMDQVTEQWVQLESRLEAVKQDLDGLAQHWNTYNHALHECNDTLTHTHYAFTTCTVATGNLDGFKSLIDKLKTIQVEFNNSGEFHEQLTTSAHNLLQVCETPTDASIHRTLDDVNARWEAMTTQLSGRVAAFDDLLSKWIAFESEFGDVVRWITRQEEFTHRLLVDEDTDQYELIENLKTVQVEVESFRERLIQLAHLSNQLTRQMDKTTVIHLTSREASLSQRLLNMQQGLARRLTNLENAASRHVTFTSTLDKIEQFVSDADSILSGEGPASGATANQLREHLKQLKDLSGNFSRMQADLEGLSAAGPGLALNTDVAARLSQVHQDWGASRASATVRCSDIQEQLLRQQDFSAKCDEWMLYLAEIERDLSEELAGQYQELTVQKQAHETFLCEMATMQQVLQAIIAEGYQMLRQGSIPDCAGFEHKLCLLEGQWQCVTRRATRKQGQLERQLESWGSYRKQLGQLERKVEQLGHGLGALDLTPASLQRTQTLLKDIKAAEREAGLTESQLQQMNECCRLVSADSDTATCYQLQAEQAALHAAWADLIQQLAGRRESVAAILALWEKTEGGMNSALQWLTQIRYAMAADVPDNYDSLLQELQHCWEFDGEFAARIDQRLQLAAQQEQLCGAVSSQDVGVLQQRIVLLNKQWVEMHHQVELRQQAVQHRLGAWTTFNDKYRDLNHSLTAMENKISSSQEFHIEDLLQKLRQDYQQELSALEAEYTQLCEQGQLLLQASSDVRASDINQKLARLHDAWRRLQDRWSRRLRKIEETLSAVQQLEHNMRRLRQWLAHIEHNLGSPLIFRCAEFSEIQQQLTQQQELQRDIEQHSGGVTSVMSLCEVLVHDADACPSHVEQGALQQAISSLSRRWRNICDLSVERRRRIEDTWQLWQQFGDDQRTFVSQLRDLETQNRQARTDTPTLAILRDDLRRTEAFKRGFDERLTALEHLNKQYRRLAREGRTDAHGDIKAQIQEADKRYDDISQNLDAAIRRLRHMIDMRADFDATRDALLTWLTDINRRITHIQHFTGASNIRQRLDELQAVEADLENKTSIFENIEKAAQYLMQKSEATDSSQVQRDLDEFRNMRDCVISNLKKLQSRIQRVPMEEVQRLRETPTQRLPPSPVPRGWSSYTDGSGKSGDSMAGDQDDPDGDGPASEGSMDDDAHFSEGREKSHRKIRAPIIHRHEKLGRVEAFLRELETSLERVNQRLTGCEQALKSPAASGTGFHTTGPNFSSMAHSCQDSVNRLMTLEKQLKRETGLPSLYGAETQIRLALKRWDKLKEAAKNRDHSVQKTRQQWSQFRIDMDNFMVWLDDAEKQQRGQNNPPLNIRDLEQSVHTHREFLHEIDARRPVMLSINLINKDDLAQPTTECRQLTVQLGTVNQRWDKVCARAAVWQKELQIALVQSADFNETGRETEEWLRDIQAQIRAQEPVEEGRKLGSTKRRKFKDILSELEQGATRLRSLLSTAEPLLADTNSQESASAREKLGYLLRQAEGLGQTCRTYLDRVDGSTGSGHDLHGRSPRSSMLHMGFEEGEISQVRSAIPPFRKSPRPYFSRKQ